MESNAVEREEVKPKSKKPLIMVALVIMALAIFGVYYWQTSLIYVKTDDARVDGSIVNVSAKIGGRLKELKVKEGQIVRAGQVIAVLDNEEMKEQLAQAQASAANAAAKLSSLQNGPRSQEIKMAEAQAQGALINMKNAQKNYQRYQNLFRQGAAAAQALDGAKTAYEMAQSQYQGAVQQVNLLRTGSRPEDIQAAQASLEQNKAVVNLNKKNLSETVVIAPVDGIVAEKLINSGEVVGAGQAIVNIINTKDLWLNARIEETKIGKLRLGQSVIFTLDAYNGVKFQGKITEIAASTSSVFSLFSSENSSGNFTKVTQRIPIRISIPNESKYKFRPGMSALIQIKVK